MNWKFHHTLVPKSSNSCGFFFSPLTFGASTNIYMEKLYWATLFASVISGREKKWLLFIINACPSLLKSVWCIFKEPLSNLSQNFKRVILFVACRPGFYKASDGNMKCAKCPPHSSTHEDGSVNCRCENNYFRADKDPPSMACTRE